MDSQYQEANEGEEFREPNLPNQIPCPLVNNKNRLQYEQFRKIYLTSYLLHTQKERLHHKAQELAQSISQIESVRIQAAEKLKVVNQEISSEEERNRKSQKQLDRPKRMRRKAEQILRSWQCKQDFCGKKYGAHASLLQHVKLKHPSVLQKYF